MCMPISLAFSVPSLAGLLAFFNFEDELETFAGRFTILTYVPVNMAFANFPNHTKSIILTVIANKYY